MGRSDDSWDSWVGFDLDGTLAEAQEPFDPDSVGPPVGKMIKVLKKHLAAGDTCKIFTARASADKRQAKKAVHAFLEEQGIEKLEVTCEKDPGLLTLYDDRAASVKKDEGTVKEAKLIDPGSLPSFALVGDDVKQVPNAYGEIKGPLRLLGGQLAFRKTPEKAASEEPSAEELLKRPCCGEGCENCPYVPRHVAGTTKVRRNLTKAAVVKQEGEEWVLYTKDGKRVLGRHSSAKKAYAQEYAIQKSEERRKAAGEKNLCPGCGEPFPEGEPYPDVEMCERCERFGAPKEAAIKQKDLRYWGEVRDAVVKKVKEGQDPSKVGVIGSCGHSIRKGPTPVKIRKKCFTCLKADDMGKAASLRRSVLGGHAYRTPTSEKSATITNVGAQEGTPTDSGPEDLKRKLRKARKDTDTQATEAETQAGNYKKGRVNIRGLHIAIENPKNSIRSGTDRGGKQWRSVMSCDYGYFTRGAQSSAPVAVDGDEIDVFIGPDLDSDFVVAIDQYAGGKFDETKFVICCKDQEAGEQIYLSNYQKGWKLGPVSTLTLPQLKEWLKDGDHAKPFKGQLVKSASPVDAAADFLRGDDKGLDWRWGLLGPSIVGTPMGLANKLYAKGVIPRVAGAPANLEERRQFRALKEQAQGTRRGRFGVDRRGRRKEVDGSVFGEGVTVNSQPKGSRMAPNKISLLNILRQAVGKEPRGPSMSASYNPFSKEITLGKGYKHPAILAHELGHARGGKALMGANVGGKALLSALLQGSLLSPNEDTAKLLAGGGTLAGAGVLASEIDASRRGFKAMRGLGASRKSALKSFIGLPTYAAFTALPGLGFLAKKHADGFRE